MQKGYPFISVLLKLAIKSTCILMRLLHFLLVGFVGLTASICGLLLIVYPDGSIFQMTPTLLEGTFLKSFLTPGIILTLIGGINMVAVFTNIHQSRNRYNWSVAGSVLLCGWIITQVLIIQSIHWLQFVFMTTGILIILLSFQLKGKWAI